MLYLMKDIFILSTSIVLIFLMVFGATWCVFKMYESVREPLKKWRLDDKFERLDKKLIRLEEKVDKALEEVKGVE